MCARLVLHFSTNGCCETLLTSDLVGRFCQLTALSNVLYGFYIFNNPLLAQPLLKRQSGGLKKTQTDQSATLKKGEYEDVVDNFGGSFGLVVNRCHWRIRRKPDSLVACRGIGDFGDQPFDGPSHGLTISWYQAR